MNLVTETYSYRSSVTDRLAAITDIGGVNSIRSFTKSWQRAAGFVEVIPQRPAFVFAPDQAPISVPEDIGYERADLGNRHAHPGTSLLRQHLEASPPLASAVQDDGARPGASHSHVTQASDDREAKALDNDLVPAFRVGSHSSGSIFGTPPYLTTPPIFGSYGSHQTYGTIRSEVPRPSMEDAEALWRQQQEAGGNVPDGEAEPILVKEVEQDGKIILTVEGQSTLPQTVFNSTKYALLYTILRFTLPSPPKLTHLCNSTVFSSELVSSVYPWASSTPAGSAGWLLYSSVLQ